MLVHNMAFKYEIPYNVQLEIMHCWTNGKVTIQYVLKKSRYSIRWIRPHISDTNIEHTNPENMHDNFNIRPPVIYSVIILKLGRKVYNWICTGILM